MKQIIVQETDFLKARKKIKEAKASGAEIVFTSNDDELSRKILEKESINVLLIKQKTRRDWLKQRNSGFNHVMAKLAKKKGVSIGIDLDEILEASQEEKAEILARVRQNIMLAKKDKLKVRFISKAGEHGKDSYNLKSLGLSLGMPTEMVKTF